MHPLSFLHFPMRTSLLVSFISAFLVVGTAAAQSPSYSLSITDGREEAAPGQTLTYVITVKNLSSSTKTTDIQVTPSSATTLQTTTPQGTTAFGTITWAGVSFAANQEKTFQFTATVKADTDDNVSIGALAAVGGTTSLDHTLVKSGASATVASSKASSAQTNWNTLSSAKSSAQSKVSRASSAGNTTWGTTTSVSSTRSRATSSAAASVASTMTQRDRAERDYPLIKKVANHTEVLPGSVIRYTITVRNVLLHTIDDAVISDRFDAASLIITDAGGGTKGDGQLQWTLPELQPGQQWTKTYSLSVKPDTKNGTALNNIVSIVGSDVSEVSVDERVRLVTTAVVTNLPTTGFDAGAYSLALFVPMAAFATVMVRRKKVA